MAKLTLTVGLPRSGKSTWARQTGHPIVNPDSIRLALHGQRFYAPAEPMVWAIARVMVEALFHAGHEYVVLDACNVHIKRREMWENHAWEVELKIVDTRPAECSRRARAEGDLEIIPVIERMELEWDLQTPSSWGDDGSEPR